MRPALKNRFKQLGNSFTSCLLTVVVVFGGFGFYYFNYFQWRHLENPLEGLTIVKTEDGAARNFFRKKAVRSVIDPLGQQIEKIKKVRKKTKKGQENYPELEQDCTEIRNRLLEIMTEARLKQIPKRFEKKYSKALTAIGQAYQAINLCEESVTLETKGAREKMYKDSLKVWKKAKNNREDAREYFHGDGWKNA